MTPRAQLLSLACFLCCLFGCAKPINDGNACFQSSECRSGSVCVATVYGKYCMQQCSADIVRCNSGASCLRSDAVVIDPGPDGGADAGTDPDGGIGTGADTDEEVWVCLPGRLENPNYLPRIIGQICDYSIDCELGGVCVCIPGATCEGEGKNGPTCQRLCDPTIINQCPQVADLQPECTDLGDGRGFCDPTTLPLPP